ncbi:MAG: hypothetical protein LBG95_03295 [Treponema sp.]|jgi:hypothetical protein|nr:hypothetical protein [Treponema sp.]
MSDTMIPAQKLAVGATIKEGIAIGAKNIGPILVNVLLWILTIWIPYLNVGTTIGLTAGIVAKAARGEVIPMTEIFDPKYRKYMGEFLLTVGLIGIGVGVGTVFGVIPGIVISLAWSLAVLLVVDKGKNPTEAITMSNNCTYGYKGKMIGIYVLTCLLFAIVQMLLGGIGAATENDGFIFLMSLIVFLSVIFEIFVFIGLQASIYKQLSI